MRDVRLYSAFTHSLIWARPVFFAALGTLLPAGAYLVAPALLPVSYEPEPDMAAVLLVASLAGLALTLFGLRMSLGPLERLEETIRDLEERQDVSRRLEETRLAADTDPLTGVLNRRGFDRRVPDHPVGAVVLLDLDHFKAVNDSFGHDAGDHVLLQVADVLRQTLRKHDVLARFGGEEFVIFLPQTDRHAATAIAERLRQTIATEVSVAGRRITASFGVAAGSNESCAELIARADRGAYAAKAAGRNRVCTTEEPVRRGAPQLRAR